MTDQTEQITHRDIAKLQGVHLATAYRQSKREGFPTGTKTDYRSSELFDRAEVLAWIEAQQVAL